MREKSLARNSGATVCGAHGQAFAVERLDEFGGQCTQQYSSIPQSMCFRRTDAV
jgi:hypothetical protein